MKNRKAPSKRRARRTPMMEQYHRLKAEHPDAILFFRMGDFYETFYEDAHITARVLDLALTSRGDLDERGEKIPLAGFPYHALEGYLSRMIQAGYKVAICEQVEDPKKAKGLVKRAIVRVVTAGTLTDPSALEQKNNRYLVALCLTKKRYGLAYADLSTGEFRVTELTGRETVRNELLRLAPAEIVHPESFRESSLLTAVQEQLDCVLSSLPDWEFEFHTARETLLNHFQTVSLDGFGIEDLRVGIGAAGALLHYLRETQKDQVAHLTAIQRYSTESYMFLDADTQRNLELLRSMRDGSTQGTLFQVLDATLTPMGGRRLRQAILQPLLDPEEINARLDAVEEFAHNLSLLDDLRGLIRGVGDVERLIGRVGLGTANARDLLALGHSLAVLPEVLALLELAQSSLLVTLRDSLDPCEDVVDLIGRAIHPEPPTTLREGRLIRDGFHPELDELRDVMVHGKERIAGLQEQERQATGIPNLRVGYNQVFGYYIEVTKSYWDQVPEHYIRKQTLANAERYITPELKELEEKILTAEERSLELEYRLFCQVREEVQAQTARIQKAAAILGMLDLLSALAAVAVRNNYVRPQVDESETIYIKEGRHPVVEQLVAEEGFVPNNTYLDGVREQIHIVTGPNMAGKSTYLRQVALIVLMAQMGSFVPAREARIGVVDRIFTRVGASDNLAMGQSTFLVEMNETANILHNATRRSLVILDEIGRGTSTFDGLSIAWAVVEYLHDQIGAKTLFATHYHELVEMAERYPRVWNYNVAVHEDAEKITFLRRVVEGGSDRSYGIHVARLAGLPEPVISRAMDILTVLESHEISVEEGKSPRPRRRPRRRVQREGGLQLSLFVPPSGPADPVWEEIRKELEELDLSQTTPLEALMLLDRFQRRLRQPSENEDS